MWACALTEGIKINLSLTKKRVAQRSEHSTRELLTFQFKVLPGALKDKSCQKNIYSYTN